MEAKLVVIEGKASRSHINLKLPTIVGRRKDSGLVVMHKSVSRQHCEIFEKNGRLYVRDNHSANGTFINGKKVSEQPLYPGDKLRIGPLLFRAEYIPEASSVETKKPVPVESKPKSAQDPLDDFSDLPELSEEEHSDELVLEDEPLQNALEDSSASFGFLGKEDGTPMDLADFLGDEAANFPFPPGVGPAQPPQASAEAQEAPQAAEEEDDDPGLDFLGEADEEELEREKISLMDDLGEDSALDDGLDEEDDDSPFAREDSNPDVTQPIQSHDVGSGQAEDAFLTGLDEDEEEYLGELAEEQEQPRSILDQVDDLSDDELLEDIATNDNIVPEEDAEHQQIDVPQYPGLENMEGLEVPPVDEYAPTSYNPPGTDASGEDALDDDSSHGGSALDDDYQPDRAQDPATLSQDEGLIGDDGLVEAEPLPDFDNLGSGQPLHVTKPKQPSDDALDDDEDGPIGFHEEGPVDPEEPVFAAGEQGQAPLSQTEASTIAEGDDLDQKFFNRKQEEPASFGDLPEEEDDEGPAFMHEEDLPPAEPLPEAPAAPFPHPSPSDAFDDELSPFAEPIAPPDWPAPLEDSGVQPDDELAKELASVSDEDFALEDNELPEDEDALNSPDAEESGNDATMQLDISSLANLDDSLGDDEEFGFGKEEDDDSGEPTMSDLDQHLPWTKRPTPEQEEFLGDDEEISVETDEDESEEEKKRRNSTENGHESENQDAASSSSENEQA